jgi:hypothetical protein
VPAPKTPIPATPAVKAAVVEADVSVAPALQRPAVATLDTSPRAAEPQGKILLGQVTAATSPVAIAASAHVAAPQMRAAAPVRPMPPRPAVEHGLTLVEESEAGE